MTQTTYTTEDHTVTKIIHTDLSETAIKTVGSCDTIRDPITGLSHRNPVDRNKYSIFVSSSKGCPVTCKFCYLTIKQATYKKLRHQEISSNVLEAIKIHQENDPTISHKFVKLCWMGMGEPVLIPSYVRYVTNTVLVRLMSLRMSMGLDGVDISTSLPRVDIKWIDEFSALARDLEDYPLNPNNKTIVNASVGNRAHYIERSRLRLFYSLHSTIQKTRDLLIPNSTPITDAFRKLKVFCDQSKSNLILHHLFLDGINDSDGEVEHLLNFLINEGFSNHELRILRYNPHVDAPYVESQRFDEIVAYLSQHLPYLKVQISQGTEVSSACGQFIVRNTL